MIAFLPDQMQINGECKILVMMVSGRFIKGCATHSLCTKHPGREQRHQWGGYCKRSDA